MTMTMTMTKDHKLLKEIKAKTWKLLKYPSTEEWIKMRYIHIMKYYSATKKNEIMSFAPTWMDPEFVLLSEVSQTEKEKYYMESLIC